MHTSRVIYCTGDLNNNLGLDTRMIDGTAVINPKYLIEPIELRILLHNDCRKEICKVFCKELAMHK